MAITRTAWTDDDGSGNNGTIINNAAKTELYDQIDEALDALALGYGVANVRLTLESGVPVSVTDQANKTSLFVTPFQGNQIGLLNGVSGLWEVVTFTEKTIDFSTGTASRPYDIFGYLSAGTLAVERLVWTNDTTRATALVLQDGIWVKSGDTTRRFLGTVYYDSGSKLQDTLQYGYVWNEYNDVLRDLLKLETTASWAGGAWRPLNNTAGNKIAIVVGRKERLLRASAFLYSYSLAAYAHPEPGVGQDSTSTRLASGYARMFQEGNGTASFQVVSHEVAIYPEVGMHYYTALENSPGAHTIYGGAAPGKAGISAQFAR